MVFSHALLEHVEDPISVLREMQRVLKPGGHIGVRIPDWDGILTWPPSALLDQALSFVTRVHAAHGGSAYRGKQLRELLQTASFIDVRMSASCESHGTTEEVQRWADTYANLLENAQFINRVSDLELSDAETLAALADAWRSWAQHPNAYQTSVWCEAVGRAPS